MSDKEDFSDDDEDGRDGARPGFSLEEQPLEVIKRLQALKKLQFENIKHEVAYYEECHKLDLKYQALYDGNNETRRKIVGGEYEPSPFEQQWKDDQMDDMIVKLEKLQVGGDLKKVSGIPNFWLTVFQNANDSLLSGTLESIDEPIMKYLEEVSLSLPETNSSFTITFAFGKNEFFTNEKLTKTYDMKSSYDTEDPLDYDGPEMVRATGCKIDWKPGKNSTLKVIKQKVKQKGKGKGKQTFLTKQEKRDSFFNFFLPPKVPEDEDDVDDVLQAQITEDFDVGFAIKEKLIPRAVLYFTGEAIEGESDVEEEEDSGEEGEED